MGMMERVRTSLLIFAVVYGGYQKCTASDTSSRMEVDSSARQPDTDRSTLIKSDRVYQSLPADLQPFNEQIAGRGLRPDLIGILNDDKGNVYKRNPPQEEVDFYEKLKNTNDPILEELRDNYVPKYYGLRQIPIDGNEVTFIHMDNIMGGFMKPCSIDVKIKHIIWNPPFSEDKPLRFKPMTDAFGFGITGFKYYDVMTGQNIQNPRTYVFDLSPNDGIRTLYKFINGQIGIRCGLLSKILKELDKIRQWFEKQRHLIINNNSVLITYDAQELLNYVKKVKASAAQGGRPDLDCTNFNVPVRLRLVFFGKVIEITEKDTRDEEYLRALNTLYPMLEDITNRNADTYYDPLQATLSHP